MPSTRDLALSAAIELLGTGGLRALTHVRVDDRAGLPKGSTSNHFRTRYALLEGVADEIVRIEPAALGEPSMPDSAEAVVELLCTTLEYATGPGRTLTTARLVLFLEASHDARLRDTLARGRAAMEGWMAPLHGAVRGDRPPRSRRGDGSLLRGADAAPHRPPRHHRSSTGVRARGQGCAR
jgi:DNA-binding transcriptional regulator YbjK